ncbi:UNVERIFIED_CONTAM: hypothetical protein HDU68_012114 [Siphonaria sp. JEL0065]|nr:hypothetical protein HDU68_012114 [Siphonaria sp. JEL0065]
MKKSQLQTSHAFASGINSSDLANEIQTPDVLPESQNFPLQILPDDSLSAQNSNVTDAKGSKTSLTQSMFSLFQRKPKSSHASHPSVDKAVLGVSTSFPERQKHEVGEIQSIQQLNMQSNVNTVANPEVLDENVMHIADSETVVRKFHESAPTLPIPAAEQSVQSQMLMSVDVRSESHDAIASAMKSESLIGTDFRGPRLKLLGKLNDGEALIDSKALDPHGHHRNPKKRQSYDQKVVSHAVVELDHPMHHPTIETTPSEQAHISSITSSAASMGPAYLGFTPPATSQGRQESCGFKVIP